MNNLEIIREKAKFYAKELWGLDFNLPIILNGRYKNIMGSLYYKDREAKIPEKIMLAGSLFDGKYNELTIDDTLLHELCHWYCSISGKQSRDNSRDFEKELYKIGASSTGTAFHVGTSYIGKCKKCGKVVIEKNSKYILSKYLNNDRYWTKCCNAQMVDAGIKETKDNNKVNDKVKELNRKFKEYIVNGSTCKC